jgi:hypothetical protein
MPLTIERPTRDERKALNIIQKHADFHRLTPADFLSKHGDLDCPSPLALTEAHEALSLAVDVA